MGLQSSQVGPSLEVVKTSTSNKVFLPKVKCYFESFRYFDAGIQRYRGNIMAGISGSSFFGTEERFRQKEDHFRSVNPQQIHLVPYFQDDDGERCSSDASSAGIHDVNRFERCVLAYPNSSSFQAFFGLQIGSSDVPVQVSPFRTQYCSSYFYKDDETHFETTETSRGLGGGLLGRLASLGRFRGGVSSGHSQSRESFTRQRFLDQLQQVQVSSSSEVRLVGSVVGHCQVNSVPSSFQEEEYQKIHSELRNLSYDIQKKAGKGTRITPVCIHSGSYWQSDTQVPKSFFPQTGEIGFEGFTSDESSISAEILKKMARSCNFGQISSSGSSPRFLGGLHGCFQGGLGSTLDARTSSSRFLVPLRQEFSHKHSRINGGLFGSQEPSNPSTFSCEGPFGQFYHRPLYQPSRLGQVSTSKFLGPFYLPSSSQEETVSFGNPYFRVAEHSGGSAFQRQDPSFRVVSGSGFFQLDSISRISSRDRSVCNQDQSQATSVCLSSSRPFSSGGRCFFPRLEPMENSLSFSSNLSDHEGGRISLEFQRSGSSSNSQLAQPSLVSNSQEQGIGSFSVTRSKTLSDVQRESLLVEFASLQHPSYLGTLTKIFSILYSKESAAFLIKSLRHSTSRQYDTVWNSFCSFIRFHNPSFLDDEFIFSFLRHLFDVKKLAPATVCSYKSALSRPLEYGFGLDVSSKIYSDFGKALFLMRPSSPVRLLSWSLELVLKFCSSPRFSVNPDSFDLFYKTLFLIALATGNRISEIKALLRGDQFIRFSDRAVTLFPNPNFLAKNEDPSIRRVPIVIQRLWDGEVPHSLCPVTSLELYLIRTRLTKSFHLFVHPIHLTDLSIAKLRLHLCKFIRLADPTSLPRSHDLRKMATSFAFFRSMDLSSICNSVGWSSAKVFLKHYLKQVENLSSSVIVLGEEMSGSVS